MTSMEVMVILQNVRRELMSGTFRDGGLEWTDSLIASDVAFKVLSKYVDKMIRHVD